MASFFSFLRLFNPEYRRAGKTIRNRRPAGSRAERKPALLLERLEDRIALAAGVTAVKTVDLSMAHPGDTLNYGVAITNNMAGDATTVQYLDTVDSNTTLVGNSVKVSPMAVSHAYAAVGNTPLVVGAGSGLKAGVVDIDGVTSNANIVVTAGTFATTAGGSVVVAADGSFTYTPQTGDQNLTDTFTYTVTDTDNLASTGVVTINLGERNWYVDSAAPSAGADGSFAHPFTSLTPLNGAGGVGDVDDANDTIFVYSRGTNYTTGFTLESGQTLHGSVGSYTVTGNTIADPGHGNAVITNAAGDAITLANDTTVFGVSVGSASGAGIKGTSITNAMVDANVTIANVTGNDFDLSGAATGTIAFGAGITNTAGHSVSIQNRSGGSVSLSGAISDTGTGIFVNSNTGATISFTGGLNLSTGANTAFTATGGGTVSATQNNTTIVNTITTTTATALNVANTTIGASNLNFRSISAGTAASGAPAKGINLDTTGVLGGLVVTGDGSTAGSGGTIQKATHGVYATNSSDLSLSWMNIINNGQNQTATGSSSTVGGDLITGNNLSAVANITLFTVANVSLTNLAVTGSAQMGINGNAVNGLTIANSKIEGNGDESFEDGVLLQNATGTVSITGTSVRDNRARELQIANGSGAMTLTTSTSQYGHTNAGTGTAESQQGILLQLFGTSNTTINATTLTISNNEGTGFTANGFQINADNGGPIVNGSITASTFDNNAAHVLVNAGGTSAVTFDTKNNLTMTKAALQSINYTVLGGSTAITANLTGTISGNTINDSGLPNANADAIDINSGSTWAGQMHIKVDSNNIQGVSGGIIATLDGSTAGGTTPRVDLRVTNNSLSNPVATAAAEAIKLNAAVTSTHPNLIVGWDVGGAGVQNTVSGHWANGASEASIFLRNRFTAAASIILPGYAGGAADDAAVTAYLAGRNTITAPGGAGVSVLVTHSNTNPFTSGTVTTPLLLAPGGVEAAGPDASPSWDNTPTTPVGPDSTAPTSGTVVAPPANTVTTALTQDELNVIVAAAIQRWAAAGLTADQIAVLQSATYSATTTLPTGYLGAESTGHVDISSSAAGYGWFVDATPLDDSEFGNGDGTRLTTDPTEAPAGHYDLLTTVEHEMGHLLGLTDHYDAASRNDLMFGYLTFGERRLPGVGEASGAVAGSVAGVDFLGLPTTIGTISAGTTIHLVFQATINNPTSATSVSNTGQVSGGNFSTVNTSTATTTVIQPTVQFSQAAYQVNENGTVIGTAVTLTRDITGASSTVRVTFPGTGSATGGGTDYTSTSIDVTFNASDTSKTFVVPIIDDALVEGTETLGMSLTALSNAQIGAQNTATLSIIDNDTASLAIQATQTATEGGGAQTITVTLTTSAGVTLATALTADVVDATGGTATTGVDYTTFGTQTVTFAAGSANGATQTVTITPTDDSKVEGDETVKLKLQNLNTTLNGQASLGNTNSLVTITDNDTASLAIQTTKTATEAGGAQTITVTLTTSAGGTLATALTADVVDATGGTATSGTDYTAFGTQTVTFAAGSANGATQTVTLTPTNDTLVEGNETVNLTLQNLNTTLNGQASLGNTASVVTITDNDTAFLAIQALSLLSEGGGAQTITVTLGTSAGATLATALTADVVDLADNTASSGVDYTAFSTQTVTFAAGSASGATQTVTLTPIDDTLVEGTELVDLKLQNLNTTLNGQVGLGNVNGTVRIIDNDTASLAIQATPTVTEGGGAQTITVTLTTSAGGTLATALTADVVDAGGGTATSGTDYTVFGTQTVTFAAGSVNGATQTVTITPTDDTLVEGNETVNLKLQNLNTTLNGQVSLGNTASAATIMDNDTASLAIQATASVVEANGPQTITVTLSTSAGGTLATALTADVVDAGGGSGVAGTDYQAFGTQTVTFAAGSANGATQTVTLTPIDNGVSGDRTVNLKLQNLNTTLNGQASLGNTASTITITDSDIPSVQFSQAAYQVNEDGTVVGVAVTLNRTNTTGVSTVRVTFPGSGTATPVTDYDDAAIDVTFNNGDAAKTIIVPIVDDALVEGTETLGLSLTPLTNVVIGAQGTATLSIIDNDTASLAIQPTKAVTEGGGAQTITVTLTTSGGALATALSADVVDAGGGSATSGTDYTAFGTQTVTFAAGSVNGATQTVNITPTDDMLVEGNETVNLTLQNLNTTLNGQASLGNTASIVMITDNDTASLAIQATPSVTEGGGAQTITVTLTTSGGALATALSADVVDAGGGSATSGTDYTAFGTQTVTFAAGSVNGATQTVNITPTDDMLVEGNETVNLTLQNLNTTLNGQASLGNTASVVTITDNDTASLAIQATKTVTEGGGAQTIMVTLTTSAGGTLATALTADVVDAGGGSATSGTDYTAFGTQTVTFAAGSANGATQTVTLTPTDDMLVEGNETVNLTLQNLNTTLNGQVSLGNTASVVTITDNDTASLAIQATKTATEGGGAQTITVTLTTSGGALGSALTADVVDAGGGTATSGSDYTAFGTQTVTFAAGSVNGATQTVTITPIDDTLIEGNETVNLTLQNLNTTLNGQASLGNTASAVTITDNDTASLSIAATPTVTENAGAQTITVTLNTNTGGVLSTALTADVVDAGGGTATSGSDYTAFGTQHVTFAPGSVNGATQTVTITPIDDNLVEGNETVNLTLQNLNTTLNGQASLGNTASTVSILDNDIDLKVTKVESIDPVIAGSAPDNLTYTVTAQNNGLTDATGVVLSEMLTLPAGVTVVSVTANAGGVVTNSTTNYTWNLGGLAAGVSKTLTVVLTAGSSTAAGVDVIADTAAVTGANENLVNTGDDSATEKTSVTLSADLQITKTDNQTNAAPGVADTYIIVVTNAGPSDVVGAKVADMFPANFTGATFTTTQTGGASGFTASGSGAISDTVNMSSGSTITYTVTGLVSPAAAGMLSNTATVTGPAGITEKNTGNNSFTDTDTLNPVSGNIVVPGTNGDDTLVVTATGPDSGSYSLNGGPAIPFTGATSFTFNGLAGNDTFIVHNPVGGLFAPTGGVFFDGGAGANGVQVLDGAVTVETFTFQPNSSGGLHNGTFTLQAGAVTANYSYSNLSPVLVNVGTPTDVIFNLPNSGADNEALVESLGGGLSEIISLAGAFEATTFANPTGSLTVNAVGTVGQTVTLDQLSGGFAAPAVTLNGGLGSDVFNVQAKPGVLVTVNGGAGANLLNFDAQQLPLGTTTGALTSQGVVTVRYTRIAGLNLNNAEGVNAIAGPDSVDRATAFLGLTAQERFVQALYLADLGRAGAKSELDGWVAVLNGPGGSQMAVAADIVNSLEARDQLVKSWYETYLGRQAQGGEEQGWANALQTGTSEEKVLSIFLASPEFYNRAQTLSNTGSADQRYVQALYLLLLNRTAEASGEAGWAAALPTLGRQGVALAFMMGQSATEFRTDVFEGYYNSLLHRPSDSNGLHDFVFSNLDMATVRIDFEAAPEFFTNG